MSDWSMHRRFARYRISLPIIHRSTLAGISVGTGWTRNLGEGGACVELAERLWPQTPLQLSLRTERGPLDVEAHVAWTGEPDSARG